jgi:hypothetical protein
MVLGWRYFGIFFDGLFFESQEMKQGTNKQTDE